MQNKPIPYGKQSIDDSDVAAVVAQLGDDWLTQGPAIARFEAALSEITSARHVVAVANGTAALHLACLAAGVGAGDEALVPDITFVATANAVRYTGGRPILVDVAEATGQTTAAEMERVAGERARSGARVKAILPVSFAGGPADLPGVSGLAKKIGAFVIEDAAHSLGGTYQVGTKTFRSASCSHSDMAILSFHPVKHLTTGEGGAITTNDDALAHRLRLLRTHGITKDPAELENEGEGPWYMEQQVLGFNYRITDIQCALGISQAKRFQSFLTRRREIARRYDEAFARLSAARPLQVREGTISAHHLYVLCLVRRENETLADVAARRLALFTGLREKGIFAQVHYIPVHRQPDFRRAGLSVGAFPGADAYYAGCISLPMFPAMADDDVDRVIRAATELLGTS